MERLRKIHALLLNSAIMNPFLFQKGSMGMNRQCIWKGLGKFYVHRMDLLFLSILLKVRMI